jgi:hypothetical protein
MLTAALLGWGGTFDFCVRTWDESLQLDKTWRQR